MIRPCAPAAWRWAAVARHASGELAQAEQLLGEAFATAEGADQVTAAASLGVLRSHQSRTAEALSLLRPAARGQVGVDHTAATLHALLFTGQLSGAGRLVPAAALEAFSRYSKEVERRQVPRFAGRAENFSGWVLRNLAATSAGLERHYDTLETRRRNDARETQIAALEDLAEQCIEDADLGGAQDRLAEAHALIAGDLVFGWRLELKHALLRARLALACEQAEQARAGAAELEQRAAALGVPRYRSVARLLRHRAEHAQGIGQDLAAVAADLDDVEASVAIEAWRWTAQTAAEFGSDAWRDRAAAQADVAGRQGRTICGRLRAAVLAVWADPGPSAARSASSRPVSVSGRSAPAAWRSAAGRPASATASLRGGPQRAPALRVEPGHERSHGRHAQPPRGQVRG